MPKQFTTVANAAKLKFSVIRQGNSSAQSTLIAVVSPGSTTRV